MFKRIFYFLFIAIFISGCSKDLSDLKSNYENKSKDIKELKEYFDKIVPKNYSVKIRYDSSDDINFSVLELTNTLNENDLLFREWNVDFEDYVEPQESGYKSDYDPKTKSLEVVKKKLKWNTSTFKELYEKLDKANCIGISNQNGTEIEYGYRGMGVLSYLVFDNNLTKEEQEKYSDDCSQIFYKDNIVFKFNPGGIGNFCITDFKRIK
jgi:hypothetical protein